MKANSTDYLDLHGSSLSRVNIGGLSTSSFQNNKSTLNEGSLQEQGSNAEQSARMGILWGRVSGHEVRTARLLKQAQAEKRRQDEDDEEARELSKWSNSDDMEMIALEERSKDAMSTTSVDDSVPVSFIPFLFGTV